MKNNTYYVTSMCISALLSIYSQNSQSNTDQTERTLISPATTDLSTINHKEAQGCIQSQGNSDIYNASTLNPVNGTPQNGKLCSPSMVKYDIPSQNSLNDMDEPVFSQLSNSSPAQQIASYCNTFFLNGEQYEFCYTQEEIDEALE
ncbi:hypothetical protein ACH5Y9_06725 [Methylomonas sp. BW4-1]|uniref:hypothetical protein n=1 Tax=Methylomonas sp. BW4-1 TaxID=3376685 RepID=UPI004041E466